MRWIYLVIMLALIGVCVFNQMSIYDYRQAVVDYKEAISINESTISDYVAKEIEVSLRYMKRIQVLEKARVFIDSVGDDGCIKQKMLMKGDNDGDQQGRKKGAVGEEGP